MAHEVAKLMLEHAETLLERTEAIKVALSLGMPLHEIEAYLDWLDLLREKKTRPSSPNESPESPR
jgi:DNA-binding transcriptional MerR regulator